MPVLQPLNKCINKPFKAKLRMLYETWMVNGPFTYTLSGKKRAPSKELVLTWINRAWNGISQDLNEKSFKSCGITNALDGSEDDAVWDEENEETGDVEEIIDNELETESEGEEGDLNPGLKHTCIVVIKRFYSQPPSRIKSITNIPSLLSIFLVLY